jgi:hypothetical protein
LDTLRIPNCSLPTDYDVLFQSFTGELLSRAPRILRDRFGKRPVWTEFHNTSKKGPSGTHAMFSLFWEIENLPKELFAAIRALGGTDFTNALDVIEDNKHHFKELATVLLSPHDLKKLEARKLIRSVARFGNADMKLRVIALGDYLSQTVLKPVHDILSELLDTIPQDRRRRQGENLVDLFKINAGSDVTYYCFDLSSFTDLFPFDLIVAWLKFV